MNVTSMLAFTSQLETAYHVLCQEVLKEFDMSQTAFDILLFLTNNPQHYTAKEISTIRRIKPNVVSVHVEKLVHDGFLKRENVVGDRRKIRLVCTKQAEPIVEKGREIQKRFHQAFMKGLSEEDIQGLKHCFQVMAENTGEILKNHRCNGNDGGMKEC